MPSASCCGPPPPPPPPPARPEGKAAFLEPRKPFSPFPCGLTLGLVGQIPQRLDRRPQAGERAPDRRVPGLRAVREVAVHGPELGKCQVEKQAGRLGSLEIRQCPFGLCHPGLKLKILPQLFCMSWCPDFEFRGTYRAIVAEDRRLVLHRCGGRSIPQPPPEVPNLRHPG